MKEMKVVETEVNTASGLMRHCAEHVQRLEEQGHKGEVTAVAIVWSDVGFDTWATDMETAEMLKFLEDVIKVLREDNDAN